MCLFSWLSNSKIQYLVSWSLLAVHNSTWAMSVGSGCDMPRLGILAVHHARSQVLEFYSLAESNKWEQFGWLCFFFAAFFTLAWFALAYKRLQRRWSESVCRTISSANLYIKSLQKMIGFIPHPLSIRREVYCPLYNCCLTRQFPSMGCLACELCLD